MPNRLELDIAKDAVKAVLETHAGKNAATALAHLGEEGGKLLAKLPGGQKLIDAGHKLASEFSLADSLFTHDRNPFNSYHGPAAAQFAPPIETSVRSVDFEGWTGCFELRNEISSAVVVPHTGRHSADQFERFDDGRNEHLRKSLGSPCGR